MTLVSVIAAIITAIATTISNVIAYITEKRLREAALKGIKKERYGMFHEISAFIKWIQDIIPFLNGIFDAHYNELTIGEVLKNNISKKVPFNSTFQYWKEHGNDVCCELLDEECSQLIEFMNLIIGFSRLYDYLLGQMEENRQQKSSEFYVNILSECPINNKAVLLTNISGISEYIEKYIEKITEEWKKIKLILK